MRAHKASDCNFLFKFWQFSILNIFWTTWSFLKRFFVICGLVSKVHFDTKKLAPQSTKFFRISLCLFFWLNLVMFKRSLLLFRWSDLSDSNFILKIFWRSLKANLFDWNRLKNTHLKMKRMRGAQNVHCSPKWGKKVFPNEG